MYKDLSLKEKAKVIREGVRLGLNSIDDILSLYDEAISYLQGGPIVTPYGQWKYPGRDTIIPSNNITMDNVNYPVLGVSDAGDAKVMMPWNDYKFRGSVVYEHPLIGNQFQLGGNTKPTFDLWYPTVPKQKNDTSSYDLRRAYNMLPFDEMEKFRTINDYHLPSVAYDEKTDTYTFLKRNGHPTLNYELDWYNSGSPDALEFRERYKLDTLSLPWRYIPRTYLEGGNTLEYLNVPEYNIALYNTVSPLGDFPNFWGALAYRRQVKDKLKNGNIYERDYKVGNTQGEKTAMAAWAKRLGIPYDELDLPVYNGDTVTLPNSLVLEIPYDTNMLKTRIQLNKALLDKYSKYRYSDVVDAAIKADLYNLDKLRETYKTGKPVGLTEFGWNSRLLVNNGEIIPIENIQSPLNVLGNYNVRYSPEERRLYYSDEYDFNQFENFVPGEPYRIRGYIDLDNNKALGGNLFKKGGPKKKLKSPEDILAEKYGVEPVVDNTSFIASPITIQDKKNAAKYKEEQRKTEIQKLQAARTPILKTDVVSLEDRDKYRNQAEWSRIIDNANKAAANFGYSIGANHPMTVNEVNANTLGALETAGWMIAPELMGLGATGYYMATDRPKEAAITAALSLGPGIIKGIKGATNTRLLNQEVKEMDKALELWKGNNSIPFNETHIIHSPYNNSKSVSNTSTLDYNTAQQIQSFTDARNKFAQKHNLPVIGYNYNQPLEELYNEGKQVIKDANAFYRGVHFWKEAAEGVGILDEKAFKEYAATHPWEGTRDIWITPKKEYAGLYGDPIRVVRPYELGKNPMNWFNEGDFDFKLAEGLKTPNATEGIYMPWRDEPKEWWRWHTIDEPYIKSFNPREETELLYIGDKPLNIYKKGGSIHIKPENRGKFTALKKRTGHSASWFKAHGTPALRKMATFALNSRHWNKHDEGGHLFLEDGQIFKRPLDDLTGRNILTSPILPPKSWYELFTIPELEPKKPQPLQPLEGTYGNKYSELIPMSDETYINNPINKGLQQDWRTHALEFAPFLAIGAGPAIGSTATWLASKPALYNLGRMTLGSEIGGRGVDLASNLFTGNSWGLNVGNVVEGITGWNPNNTMVGLFITDATNPGYAGKEGLASLAGLFTRFGKRKPNIPLNNYLFTYESNPFELTGDKNDIYNKIRQIQKDAKINYILTGEEPSGAVKSFFFELPKEGVDFYKTPITTLTKEVFNNLVFPRLFKDPNRIEDFELLYGSDYGIELAKKQMMKDVYAQKQYMVKPELYEALETLKGSTAGVNYENKGVLIKDIPNNLSYAEGHELRHTTQSIIPRTENEENILSNAYKDVPNPYEHDYDMSKEWETMNFDARKAVLGEVHGKSSVEIQNKIIEKMSDAQIVDKVYKSDGYWRHYIDDLVDKSGIEGPREFVVDEMLKTPEFQLKIKSWKNAMMKVGAVSGVIAGVSNNKNKK